MSAKHPQYDRSWHGKTVPLTRSESRVVAALNNAGGQIVTYRHLYDSYRGKGFTSGRGDNGFNVNVRTVIKRIRRKFEAVDENFDRIECEAGVGFRWRP